MNYHWRCHRCGAVFSAWAPAQRHVDQDHGAGRIENFASAGRWRCSECDEEHDEWARAMAHVAAHGTTERGRASARLLVA